MLRVVHGTDPNAEDGAANGLAGGDPDLDELCRLAAREMIGVALEAERRAWLDAHADVTDATGKRLVVGNGYLPERTITTGAGQVEVKAPRVADKRAKDERERFSSSILPRYMRKSPKVTEVLPVLYLRGLSTGDFAPALAGFFGSDAGLSASTVNRLTEAWQAEHQRWSARDLSAVDYVYLWADGVYPRVRLPDSQGNRDPLCLLVIVGVRADGTKELVTVADGYRESSESWAEVLRELRDRGMTAPVLAVGDGALGLWNALGQVWPETLHQRCWVHYADLRVMPMWGAGSSGRAA
jgi:putative transposase